MYGRIVVGTDGSQTASTAVEHALALAASVGGRVEVVSAYEPVPGSRVRAGVEPPPPDLQWEINPREEVDATLGAAAEQARSREVAVQVHARQGDPADAILDVAEETRADLIVIGHKGMTGARRFLLGSVPNKISHHAPCSVLIVRTG
jgi:nucleotide-binding universal stress UspA family protein